MEKGEGEGAAQCKVRGADRFCGVWRFNQTTSMY